MASSSAEVPVPATPPMPAPTMPFTPLPAVQTQLPMVNSGLADINDLLDEAGIVRTPGASRWQLFV